MMNIIWISKTDYNFSPLGTGFFGETSNSASANSLIHFFQLTCPLWGKVTEIRQRGRASLKKYIYLAVNARLLVSPKKPVPNGESGGVFMVIGITGGIGCGKSTFSKLLSKALNAPIIDADKISHEAFSSNEILIEMCNFLGDDILNENGYIDKLRVANIVFLDVDKLKKLNSIIHPYVMRKISDRVKTLSKEYAYIIIDVPLPNDDFIKLSDFIITVWADLDVRIDRLKKRSNFTEEAIMARIKKQMSQEEYESLANKVIYNNGSIDNLENCIKDIKPQLINYRKFMI